MKHLQKVTIRILNTDGTWVFRDCTQGKEYEGQYVAVGEKDVMGCMTDPEHAPCYQFKDDKGDWVVVAYADKYLDVTAEAEAPEHLSTAYIEVVYRNAHNLRDCTTGKVYSAQYVAVGELDDDGLPTLPEHAPCYQFEDDAGDTVVLTNVDSNRTDVKLVDSKPAEPVAETNNPNGIPCVIVWNESGTTDLTKGKEYPGFIVTDSVKRLLDGVPYFPNGTLYVQMFDDVNDPCVRRYEAGRFSFK